MPKGYSNTTGLPVRKGKIQSESAKEKLRQYKAERASSWKGDKVSKKSLHKWLIETYGYPKVCEVCGKKGEKVNGLWNIQLSNKDHTYSRLREDYNGRCVGCHYKYDLKIRERRRNKKGIFIK